MKLAAILIVMAGVLFAQTNTNDPADTPTVRALVALLPLRDQANYGRWLAVQAHDAQFASWLGAQTKGIGPAKFAAALGQPALLLQVREAVDRPNYGGNAYEAERKMLWLRVAEGKPVQ
jgi:hypothetical protein